MKSVTNSLTEGDSQSKHLAIREYLDTSAQVIPLLLTGSSVLPTSDYARRSLTSALMATTTAENFDTYFDIVLQLPTLHQIEYLRTLLLALPNGLKFGQITSNPKYIRWSNDNYELIMGA